MKAVRDTLELDIEQQVAEYQDMMKCCANLQQENMVNSITMFFAAGFLISMTI